MHKISRRSLLATGTASAVAGHARAWLPHGASAAGLETFTWFTSDIVGAGGQITEVVVALDGTVVCHGDSEYICVWNPATSNWDEIVTHSNFPIGFWGAQAVAIAPSNSDRIVFSHAGNAPSQGGYAWLQDGRSSNWQRLNFPRDTGNVKYRGVNCSWKAMKNRLMIDPYNPNVIYRWRTDNLGLHRSFDAGVTVEPVTDIPAGPYGGGTVCFDYIGGTTTIKRGRSNYTVCKNIYVSSYTYGVYLSQDGGETWVLITPIQILNFKYTTSRDNSFITVLIENPGVGNEPNLSRSDIVFTKLTGCDNGGTDYRFIYYGLAPKAGTYHVQVRAAPQTTSALRVSVLAVSGVDINDPFDANGPWHKDIAKKSPMAVSANNADDFILVFSNTSGAIPDSGFTQIYNSGYFFVEYRNTSSAFSGNVGGTGGDGPYAICAIAYKRGQGPLAIDGTPAHQEIWPGPVSVSDDECARWNPADGYPHRYFCCEGMSSRGLSGSGAHWRYNDDGSWLQIPTNGYRFLDLAIDHRTPGRVIFQRYGVSWAGWQQTMDAGHHTSTPGNPQGTDVVLESTDVPWQNASMMSTWPYGGPMKFDPTVDNFLWSGCGIGMLYRDNIPDNPIPTKWAHINVRTRGVRSMSMGGGDHGSVPGGPTIIGMQDRGFMRITNPGVPPSQVINGNLSVGGGFDYAWDNPDFQVFLFNPIGDHRCRYTRNGRGATPTYTDTVQNPVNLTHCNVACATGAAAGSESFVIFYGDGYTPKYTRDCGNTFTPCAGLPNRGWTVAYYACCRCVAADRVSKGVYYAANRLYGLYMSNDHGANWSPITSTGLKFNRSSDKYSRIMRSAPYDYRAEPHRTTDLWYTGGLNSRDGLWHSTNGTHWTAIRGVSNVTGFDFGRSTTGTGKPTIIFYGHYNGQTGVWLSDDYGANWRPMYVGAYPGGTGRFVTYVAGDMRYYGTAYIIYNIGGHHCMRRVS